MPVVVAKRFYLIVLSLILIGFIVVAVAANSGSKPVVKPTPTPTIATPTPTPAVLSFTVKAGVGIASVLVTNQNSGAKITLTPQELPATFNFRNGDTLSFKVTANPGYIFNAWVFGDSTFQSQNPYVLKATSSFTMESKFLLVNP
jgi:hypothetical protein